MDENSVRRREGRSGSGRHGVPTMVLLAILVSTVALQSSPVRHLASGLPAAQSSTFEGAMASLAVDGNPDGSYRGGSVSLTHRDPYPFWWVDLGEPTAVGSVVVRGRTDAHVERLNHFILIGLPDGASPATEPLLATFDRRRITDPEFTRSDWTIHRSDQQFIDRDASEVVPLAGTFRYIYLILPRADYLQLAEVEVWPPTSDG